MDILFIAIPLALAIAAFFVGAFLWSVRSGQMDDLETPAIRMLFDDEPNIEPKSNSGSKSESQSKE